VRLSVGGAVRANPAARIPAAIAIFGAFDHFFPTNAPLA